MMRVQFALFWTMLSVLTWIVGTTFVVRLRTFLTWRSLSVLMLICNAHSVYFGYNTVTKNWNTWNVAKIGRRYSVGNTGDISNLIKIKT